MVGTMSSAGKGASRLRIARQTPRFLGAFFRSGRADARYPIEITEGLWTLLSWCWARGKRERDRSDLCCCLIHEPGGGWREERDVVDALARGTKRFNPARLEPEGVERFVTALLAEGEEIRGRRARLEVHLDFSLPPLADHPRFSAETIRAALHRGGAPRHRIEEHLGAVFPERRPYMGTWILRLEDRLQAVGRQAACGEGAEMRAVPLTDSRLGNRSRLSLWLRHARDLAGYFELSLASEAALATAGGPLAGRRE
jgi:hypothetical protein